jgi:peptidyl-prolyl isomerase D
MPQTLEDKIKVSEEYKKAIGTYKRVFLYIDGLNQSLGSIMGGKSKEEIPSVAKLRASVNMNISFCYFKLGDLAKSLHHIKITCGIEKENAKANFRRGQVYLALNDIDNAKLDFDIARKAFPQDSAIQDEYKILEQKFAQYAQKEKVMYKKMFE